LSEDDVDLLVPVLGELALSLVLTDAKDERDAIAEQCVSEARRTNDPDLLAGALQARRIALMGPVGTEARVADAREVLALPREMVAAEHRLAAHLALVEDLIELGDRRGVDDALGAAVDIARVLAHPYWSWATMSWQALVAIVDNRLDEAEELAFAALGHQAPAEHPEALAALGVNLTDIRLFQGRSSEMVELLRDAADANPHIPCYRAVLALCCMDAGDEAGAREAYAYFSATDFEVPPDSNWLLTVAVLADVAATLGDAIGARILSDALMPYADRHVVLNCFGGGGAYWGPVAHHLGRCCAVMGAPDQAGDFLDRARESARAFGANSFLARTDKTRIV
jgi:tetratricopeptide (TPR) repeat protein